MKKWFPWIGIAAILGFSSVAVVKLGKQDDGRYLVSSLQHVELLGVTKTLQGQRPKDMAVSPDGKLVALLAHRRVYVAEPNGNIIAEIAHSAGALGIAWSPDGRKVYATLATGKIASYSWSGGKLAKLTELAVVPATVRANPGTTGLAVASNGTIYVALSIKNQVVALSPEGIVLTTWAVDACPYHLAISPDGRTLVSANRGGVIVKPAPEQGDPESRGKFEGTGVAHAKSANTEVQVDPRTDAGLSGTISIIALTGSGAEPKTLQVGRQPSGMAFSKDGVQLYVANSDEESVSIVDLNDQRVAKKISITPAEDPGFGQIPTDVALSPDGKRLYVSLGGANAIAVIEDGKVLGYVPTAWYPISIRCLGDNLVVGCAKGIGSRPSSKTTGFGVHDSVGVYQSIPLSSLKDLPAMTARVAINNSWTKTPEPRADVPALPIPERVGEPSKFDYVVYIIKENMTYDIAMGDFEGANGDPSLCTFPETVTPNHHALARQFGVLDNFYISGTNSADGHQWVASSVANGYTEQNYSANTRSYPYDGGDPLAFSPSGFLWTQAKAAKKSVRVFGEFVDQPQVIDTKTGKAPSWPRAWEDYKSGKGEVTIKAVTSQAALREHLVPNYIGFPAIVSDQYRADVFLSELKGWESDGKMPQLTMMLLPNDHTGGTRANFPTPRAAVADNDLALGRIVEGITKSKFWQKTLIIVAQDDSQLGYDHVDGHRSIAFVISPYSRKGATISDLYTHASIASTIGHVLGVPPMTRFDRTAKPMNGCFGSTPDLGTFTALKNNIPLDELNPPAKKLTGEAKRMSELCEKMDWDELDTQDKNILNRAVWLAEAPRSVARRGFSTTQPTRR